MATLASGAAVKKAVPASAAGAAAAVVKSAGEASMLMRRWREFTTCGEPVRFLFFDRESGKWVDIGDREVAEELRQAFRERRVFAEATFAGGRAFLFDFLRMARIDVATTEETGLAWIDARGACYFPAPGAVGSRKRRRDDADDADEAASSSVAHERGPNDGAKKSKARRQWVGAVMLQEGDKEYEIISKMFLTRGMASRGAELTALRKVARGPRNVAFQREERLLAAKRGNAIAAPKWAWYAAAPEDMAAAVKQGITKTNATLLGARAHGNGVHLSPPQFPLTSAMLSKADETGEVHVVLCRVLTGQAEVVAAGSSQSQPSSAAYDSAVDNTANPGWYVVWSKDMNRRIQPEYVVSFKCSNLHAGGSSEATSKPKEPCSVVARDMFPTLLAELGKHVSPQKCHTLHETYVSFKKGNIKKEQFTKFLRAYVGDNVLSTVAKKLRGSN